jgi:hypothetical protein
MYDVLLELSYMPSYILDYSSATRGVIILIPTLGLSWGFSVIAVNHDALVWKYLFAIFASLQVREKITTPKSISHV